MNSRYVRSLAAYWYGREQRCSEVFLKTTFPLLSSTLDSNFDSELNEFQFDSSSNSGAEATKRSEQTTREDRIRDVCTDRDVVNLVLSPSKEDIYAYLPPVTHNSSLMRLYDGYGLDIVELEHYAQHMSHTSHDGSNNKPEGVPRQNTRQNPPLLRSKAYKYLQSGECVAGLVQIAALCFSSGNWRLYRSRNASSGSAHQPIAQKYQQNHREVYGHSKELDDRKEFDSHKELCSPLRSHSETTIDVQGDYGRLFPFHAEQGEKLKIVSKKVLATSLTASFESVGKENVDKKTSKEASRESLVQSLAPSIARFVEALPSFKNFPKAVQVLSEFNIKVSEATNSTKVSKKSDVIKSGVDSTMEASDKLQKGGVEESKKLQKFLEKTRPLFTRPLLPLLLMVLFVDGTINGVNEFDYQGANNLPGSEYYSVSEFVWNLNEDLLDLWIVSEEDALAHEQLHGIHRWPVHCHGGPRHVGSNPSINGPRHGRASILSSVLPPSIVSSVPPPYSGPDSASSCAAGASATQPSGSSAILLSTGGARQPQPQIRRDESSYMTYEEASRPFSQLTTEDQSEIARRMIEGGASDLLPDHIQNIILRDRSANLGRIFEHIGSDQGCEPGGHCYPYDKVVKPFVEAKITDKIVESYRDNFGRRDKKNNFKFLQIGVWLGQSLHSWRRWFSQSYFRNYFRKEARNMAATTRQPSTTARQSGGHNTSCYAQLPASIPMWEVWGGDIDLRPFKFSESIIGQKLKNRLKNGLVRDNLKKNRLLSDNEKDPTILVDEHVDAKVDPAKLAANSAGQVDPAERIRVLEFSSADRRQVKRALYASEHPLFDIILDDGNHSGGAMQLTFEHLFLEFLAPGGLYLIEDTNIWARGNPALDWDKNSRSSEIVMPSKFVEWLVFANLKRFSRPPVGNQLKALFRRQEENKELPELVMEALDSVSELEDSSEENLEENLVKEERARNNAGSKKDKQDDADQDKEDCHMSPYADSPLFTFLLHLLQYDPSVLDSQKRGKNGPDYRVRHRRSVGMSLKAHQEELFRTISPYIEWIESVTIEGHFIIVRKRRNGRRVE